MKPLLTSLLLLLTTLPSLALWQPLGNGVNGRVFALTVHNNELYAGGNFPGLISKWDGVNWVTVGAGFTGTSVRALISFNGELYVGGLFNVAGTSGNVARWDGAAWVGVGDGLGGVSGSGVYCFKERNGELFAGGTFTQSGTSSVSKVAKLAGASWTQVGGGAPPNCSAGVYAMENYNGQLYVGGQGSAPWMNILNAASSTWIALPAGGPMGGVGVYALSAFRYPSQSTISLFIGGDFTAGPSPTCCVYSNGNWGTSLNFFSAGTSDQVNAFLTTTKYIYAGGVFSVTGFTPATNFAKKSTSLPWDTAGVTINGSADAFAIYHGYLVCGGDFTTANGNTVNHVMINDGIFVSTNGPEEKSTPTLFPNPAHSTIHYSPQYDHSERQLTLFDVAGKQVFEMEIQKECDIYLGNLKTGLYVYNITERGIKIISGKIVLN